MMRDLATLPKAHLHLHFTGSMRPSTLVDLAQQHGMRLPAALLSGTPLQVTATERGWFRFQRLYDAAPGRKRFELVQGGSHHNTNSVGQAQYRAALPEVFGADCFARPAVGAAGAA